MAKNEKVREGESVKVGVIHLHIFALSHSHTFNCKRSEKQNNRFIAQKESKQAQNNAEGMND